MKRVLAELLLALLIASMVLSGSIALFYMYVPDQYETNYVEAMWDKYNKLHSLDEPKVVLIGDSNLAFGIDSEYIEKQIHMPVVNMGLHGGLGNDIQTRIAMSNVHEGDIYVICYSDYSQKSDISQKDLTLVMLSHYRELWDLLTIKQKVELIPAIPDYMFNSMSYYIRKAGNEDIPLEYSDYSKKGFNKYGDNTVRIENNKFTDFSEYSPTDISVCEETLKSLKYWTEYCEQRNAYMVLASYPIIVNGNQYQPEEYQDMYSFIQDETGCLFISNINDYMLDQEYFYDSILHMTNEGAYYRSKILADEITDYMDTYYRR